MRDAGVRQVRRRSCMLGKVRTGVCQQGRQPASTLTLAPMLHQPAPEAFWPERCKDVPSATPG